ncbi:MAG: hypothetical protein M1837_002797 [Sclerophora amabilis]|nr:MAG: hypothetical protein M1837_002797 [Sclerophora amabilis]
MAEQFSERQIRSIMIAERLASILSLLGSFYIIVTFLSSCAFHKPINRLIFCACFGNIIVSVATIISRDGMFAGDDSRLCQMQAFMIQMFLPADLLWTLVSAFNVYLTFFKKYTSDQLKALEWKYILACYGIPFIPAFVYIFVRSSSGARIYGPAEIWCWITVEWRILRVAALYAPIWIAIFLIIVIYASVGFEILKKHRQLRKFRKQQPNLLMTAATQGRPWVLRTTDVQITHECINQARETRRMSVFSVHSNTATNDDPRPYTITIESAHSTSNPDSAHRAMRTERIATAADANAAAWTYTRTAFFLFIGILFTWVGKFPPVVATTFPRPE